MTKTAQSWDTSPPTKRVCEAQMGKMRGNLPSPPPSTRTVCGETPGPQAGRPSPLPTPVPQPVTVCLTTLQAGRTGLGTKRPCVGKCLEFWR